MRFLLRTLSLSYFRRHGAKTALTLLGVLVGVATFTAIRGAQGTLVGGIRRTVDRMAGKAQLQVSQEGGVPEGLQEVIREVPGVRAQAPVIEQIVVPERGELGSLLVLGVDLLGDREMRDYGFSGEDADLDDPLLFLAQPDSVAVTRTLAEKARIKTGDGLVLKLPAGPRKVTVRIPRAVRRTNRSPTFSPAFAASGRAIATESGCARKRSGSSRSASSPLKP